MAPSILKFKYSIFYILRGQSTKVLDMFEQFSV